MTMLNVTFAILYFLFIGFLSNASKYDQSINLFNPNGRLLQVDYAETASKKGSPIISFILNNTVVILTPSRSFDNQLDRRCIDKVEKIDDNIFAGYTGLAGDGRAVIRLSRSVASDFRRSFGSSPPVSFIAKRIGDFQHQATLKGDRRPLGINIIFVGFEAGQPQLYTSGPSGLVVQWKAVAIGKESEEVLGMLESCYESSETVPSVESEQSFLRSIYDIVSSPTIWGSLEEEEVSVDSNTKSNPIGVSQVTRPMGCDVYMIKMDDKGSSFVVHTNVTTIDEFIQILSPNKLMS